MIRAFDWVRCAVVGMMVVLAMVPGCKDEPAEEQPTTQEAATQPTQPSTAPTATAPTTQEASPEVVRLLEAWEASYLPIRGMSVTYSEKPAPLGSDPTTFQGLPILKPDPVRVERIESGQKYHLRYWIYSEGLEGEAEYSQFAFDGETSLGYWKKEKMGIIAKGRARHGLEDLNSMKRYMLLNTYGYKEEDPRYAGEIPEFSSIVLSNINSASVRDEREEIAGTPCRVLDVFYGGASKEKSGWRMWVAEECG